ncbi:MAG: bifunctional diaminohydroxyphosphoribosylaminopyrimidine deaminase/5-amino-6-(5-phosphoribosylamino)uracil reductase RibD [Pseudomonadota bacterium]
MKDDARWMRSALGLARQAVGRTWPNPAVGAIIVRDGRVLGRGVTAPGGRPHAETEALRMAGDAVGATAYVTLEPCAHHGITPPCSQSLIDARIARVVCPLSDPDPRVSGRGFNALEAAGVSVDVGLMEREARALNAGFLSRIERGRPHVMLKLATTLDGRIATGAGESRWITGPAARRRVHLMRAASDAVLIGAGTARADDPMLDVRGVGLSDRIPVRIVADPSLTLSLSSRLARSVDAGPVWLLAGARADAGRAEACRAHGIEVLTVPSTADGVLSPGAMLTQLGDRGITRLMCEGGGRLAATLASAGLVDEIALFQAGKLIGNDGTPAIAAFGLEELAAAPAFDLATVEQIGSDMFSRWTVRR